jgi:fumarate reductase subunit C
VVLGPSGNAVKALKWFLPVLVFGLACAVAGGLTLPSGRRGFVGLLTWSLLVLGSVLVLAAAALLVGAWWRDRPATLSAAGIRVRSGLRPRTIRWSEVVRHEVLTADQGRRRLLAIWLSSDGMPVWLGDTKRSETGEDEILALVRHWSTDRPARG